MHPLILRSWSWPWMRPWTWLWAWGWSLFPWLGATGIFIWGWWARCRFGRPFFLPVPHWGLRTTAKLLLFAVLLGSTAGITLWLHLGTTLWTGLAFCWMRPGLARTRARLGFAGSGTGPAVTGARFSFHRLSSSRSGTGITVPLLAVGTGSERSTKSFWYIFLLKSINWCHTTD